MTLKEVHRRGIQFRSEPADVLEYAVYLGMELKEDIELLWIADEALQADDPEGWDQAESRPPATPTTSTPSRSRCCGSTRSTTPTSKSTCCTRAGMWTTTCEHL